MTPSVASVATSVSGSATPVDPDTVEIEVNQHALQRYFDRPEVIKACREQANIQTPDFTQIPDHEVGGRFRTRSNADEVRARCVNL